MRERLGLEIEPRVTSVSAAGAAQNFRNRTIAPVRPVLKKSISPEIAARLFPQDACGLRLDAKHVLSVPEFGTSVMELAQVFEHALPYLEVQRPDQATIVRLRVA